MRIANNLREFFQNNVLEDQERLSEFPDCPYLQADLAESKRHLADFDRQELLKTLTWEQRLCLSTMP